MSRQVSTCILALLLLGAAVNLAAGARRPWVERRILASNYTPHADNAAAAVQRLVPPGATLQVVVYPNDFYEELDCAVWFDYRLRWLILPRTFHLYRFAGERIRPDDATWTGAPPGLPTEYRPGDYVLFFRASASPELPPRPLEILARDPMWVLARVPAG